jgi:hypothetical protein
MKRHFTAPTPRFGRVNNRLPIGHQQRSPYYWWWAYLRRNEQYLQCCRDGGKGPLAALYADFGDVQNDNFHQWWTEGDRGVNLFAEQPLAVKFGELASAADWAPHWDSESVMVVAVPLTMSKRALKGAFAALLDKRHKGHTAGRPSMSKKAVGSTARYKLSAELSIHHLKTALAVYDLWVANSSKPKNEQMAQWEMGAAVGINPTAAKLAVSQHKADREGGRNVLAATVNRYLREAKAMVANTGLGVFPMTK